MKNLIVEKIFSFLKNQLICISGMDHVSGDVAVNETGSSISCGDGVQHAADIEESATSGIR